MLIYRIAKLLHSTVLLLIKISIKGFLKKLIPIYVDNNRAIALALNPKFYTITKYITIRFYRLYKEVATRLVYFIKILIA